MILALVKWTSHKHGRKPTLLLVAQNFHAAFYNSHSSFLMATIHLGSQLFHTGGGAQFKFSRERFTCIMALCMMSVDSGRTVIVGLNCPKVRVSKGKLASFYCSCILHYRDVTGGLLFFVQVT